MPGAAVVAPLGVCAGAGALAVVEGFGGAAGVGEVVVRGGGTATEGVVGGGAITTALSTIAGAIGSTLGGDDGGGGATTLADATVGVRGPPRVIANTATPSATAEATMATEMIGALDRGTSSGGGRSPFFVSGANGVARCRSSAASRSKACRFAVRRTSS